MIVRPVSSRSLRANRRLDCKYFLSPGTQAAERLAVAQAAGVEVLPLGGPNGVAEDVWAPSRFKRVYAAIGEPSVPYLRPYDVFDYVPQAADYLSATRSPNLKELMAPPGALLQTCSGRNLGPAVLVDDYLARFALSHDLVRVEIADEMDRFYVAAFLSTPTGQALVRRDKTGSVIDHISVSHLEGVLVPFISEELRRQTADLVASATRLRQEARVALTAAIAAVESGLPDFDRSEPLKAGWTVRAGSIGTRVDAAFHDPLAAKIRSELRNADGPRLVDIAYVRKPAGRYKTYYVEADHGRPLLSGRQLLQHAPVNLQYLSTRSVDPARYELKQAWLAIQADGRSEERLGLPVMIEPGRSGWLASGHVARIVPRSGTDAGWLFAAFATEAVQAQVRSLACGSVVDALYEEDLGNVVLPPMPSGFDGASIVNEWAKFSTAAEAERQARDLVEGELTRISGEVQESA